jgi:2-polyprenyl-6-methoxyphenol hydroxylase-like FAD-dependent oxidoreductase
MTAVLAPYEVAIIGGGPAGSVAAFVLARAGLNVVLLDNESRTTGDPGRGETLSPAAAPVLARLELTEWVGLTRMPRVTGHRSRWGSSRTISRPGFTVSDGATISLDRSSFDAALRAAAAERGTTVLRARVDRLTRENGAWRLDCRNGEQLRACFVVDASGRGSRFIRSAGARLVALDRLVAVVGAFEPRANDRDRNVIIESIADGWLFTTLDSSACRIVSFFTDSDLWSVSDSRQSDVTKLSRVLAESDMLAPFAIGQRRCVTKLWPAGSLTLDRAAVPGMLAIGDAEQTRDPLSSQGIVAAMEDAEAASSLLAMYFEHDSTRVADLHEYDRRRRLANYLQERYLYYRTERRWTAHEFWRRRHDLTEIERVTRRLAPIAS